MNEIRELTDGIHGWLTEREGLTLYELSKRCSALGPIVEIGSWRGKSTVWLARGAKAGSGCKVFAVDPHTGSPENRKEFGAVWTFDDFMHNIERAGVGDCVVPLVMTSAEAAESFEHEAGLIFIDGAHDYASVSADWMMWSGHLANDGVLAFHDAAGSAWGWVDPGRAMRDAFRGSRMFKHIRFVDSLAYAEKVAHQPALARVGNLLALGRKDVLDILYRPLVSRLSAFVRWHVTRSAGRR